MDYVIGASERSQQRCSFRDEGYTYVQDTTVKDELGLAQQDELVGFLYLGTAVTQNKPKPPKESADFFEVWE